MSKNNIPNRDGERILVVGKSGSGKTHKAKELVKNYKRVIVYDPKTEWCMLPGFERSRSRLELIRTLRDAEDAPLLLAHTVAQSADEFDFWTRAAFNAARRVETAVIAEEVAAVTTTGKAKDGWNTLINQSRAFGVDVFIIAQRGEEIDKTSINQASQAYIFNQSAQGRKYLAGRFDIEESKLPKVNRKHYHWKTL